MVHGLGEEAGRALVEHPGIDLVSFTGSSETGASVGATCGRTHKRVCLEMGGKNAQVVMEDADLELALVGAPFSILSDRSTLSRLEGSLRLATPMAAPKTHSGFGNAILQGECLLESSPRSRTSRRAVNNSREKREGYQSNHSLSSNLSSRKSQYLAVLSSQSQSQQHSWSWSTKSGAFTRVSESDTAPKNHVARGT